MPPLDLTPSRPLPTEADRKLRLFFSVDVAGSTDYKTKQANIEDFENHWSSFYPNFFQDFSNTFFNLADSYREAGPGQFENLKVWKLLGDEILFVAEVLDAHGACALTKAFYEVLCDLDQSYFEKYFLRLKGAGWTAGFPVRNSVIEPVTGLLAQSDYIGPDLDIGFRLCQIARPGRMTVSIDLADLLAQTSEPTEISFHHVGWKPLPGVFNSKPYPVIWICLGKSPYILPWEAELCPFTKKFHDGAAITNEKLCELIKSIRDALPELKLFPPYFDEANMPDHHRRTWDGWMKTRGRQEGVETLDMGEN